jgi:hypothetical protein
MRMIERRLVADDRQQLGDVHALVPHALGGLDDVQQRRDRAQVAGHGRLQREQGEDPLVDLEVAPVDAVVVGDHDRRELDVLVAQGLEHAVEGRDDHVEGAERLDLEPVELLAEVRSRAAGHRSSRTCPSRTPPSGSRSGW